MARKSELDTVEREALLIGYGQLLERVNEQLQEETPLKAVLNYQRKDLEARIKTTKEAKEK